LSLQHCALLFTAPPQVEHAPDRTLTGDAPQAIATATLPPESPFYTEFIMESLEIADSKLRYFSDKDGNKLSLERELIWAIEIKDLILIAEYTTNEGPQLDDYFFEFVFAEDGIAYKRTCSFYIKGRDEVLKTLADQYGMELKVRLLRSTEWESRVLWPTHLAGSDYFKFKVVQPVGILEKIRKALFGPQLEYGPTDSILEYYRQTAGKRKQLQP
jgi:hypothetical protein